MCMYACIYVCEYVFFINLLCSIIKFQGNLLRLLEERLNTTNTGGGSVDLDVTLSKMAYE